MDVASSWSGFRSGDELFVEPFVDLDEWRDEPVRHRYVHGGFTGTDLRFSFYYPPSSRYGGRFFHPLLHIAGTEHGATSGLFEGAISFSGASGAYLVESNMGRTVPFPGSDPTLAFRASAAAARFSRVLAAEMYGEHRPFGYVYGGSGGAFKTISCFENVFDVWDGAVPFVQGTPVSIPNVFSVQAHAMRLLWGKFDGIVDALDPGGSGDMFAGLDVEQREALAEVTRMGFPPRSWFDVGRINRNYTMLWTVFAEMIRAYDPEYFTDFWTVPGYLGAGLSESLREARVEARVTVAGLVTADEAEALGVPGMSAAASGVNALAMAPVALRIDPMPVADLRGSTMVVQTGSAAGRRLHIADTFGDVVLTGLSELGPGALGGIAPGDEVTIDNADYLAFQTFHRHQVPVGIEGWDQYLAAGEPVYPQRREVLGPHFARMASGSVQSGRFAGKMIVVQNLMDEAAHPVQAVWYRRRVEAAVGAHIDDHYRLWFTDHAMHESPSPRAIPDNASRAKRLIRTVQYAGVLEQALLDVSAWVEQGLAPPSSTEFDVVDGQVVVPHAASARRGIQPTVELRVNGGARADVVVGEQVTFAAEVEVPAGTGFLVAAEWDFEGGGDFPVQGGRMDGSAERATLTTTYAFDRAGTYFPALRVTSQRRGAGATPFTRVQNLGRVRVVVA